MKTQIAKAAVREAHRQVDLACGRALANANVLKARGATEAEIVAGAIDMASAALQALLVPLIEHDLSDRVSDGRTVREAARDVRAMLDEMWAKTYRTF